MVSVMNKQLLLTAYAYLFIMEQQKVQQGSEALQLQMEETTTSGPQTLYQPENSSVTTVTKTVYQPQTSSGTTASLAMPPDQNQIMADALCVSTYLRLAAEGKWLNPSSAIVCFKNFLYSQSGVPKEFLDSIFEAVDFQLYPLGVADLKLKLESVKRTDPENGKRVEMLWAEFFKQLERVMPKTLDQPQNSSGIITQLACQNLVADARRLLSEYLSLNKGLDPSSPIVAFKDFLYTASVVPGTFLNDLFKDVNDIDDLEPKLQAEPVNNVEKRMWNRVKLLYAEYMHQLQNIRESGATAPRTLQYS